MILVGLVPDERYRAALRLGTAMALSSGRPLRLCTVISGRPSGRNVVDLEYLEVLESAAAQGLREIARRVNPAVEVSVEVRRARSVSRGLLAAAEENDAAYMVVGSSPSGPLGRVAMGGVADRLLHGAKVPVAVAPREYSVDAGARISRVTVAFGGDASDDLVVAAAAEAAGLGAELRLASFVVHPVALFGTMIEAAPESLVIDRWAKVRRSEVDSALARARRLHGAHVDAVVGQGNSWHEAVADVPWRQGDVLVVGSGSGGLLSQVFIGSQASKIIRHAPVPVVCVPRRAAEAAADEAESAAGSVAVEVARGV